MNLLAELGEGYNNNLESRRAAIKDELAQQKLQLEGRKLDVAMYKNANDLKIARENRNRHDK